MIKKSTLFFLTICFFGYASGVFLGYPKMLSKGKNHVLSFVDVLLCLIRKDIFLYTLCIFEVISFFLSYVLNISPHITYRFCEIKATLIVEKEVTKGGFVNLCTSFCSFNPLNVSVDLI